MYLNADVKKDRGRRHRKRSGDLIAGAAGAA
jgi:hypothetical protein